MSPQMPPAAAVGLWVAAVAGALTMIIGPLLPSELPVEALGLAVCLTATLALLVWFLRR